MGPSWVPKGLGYLSPGELSRVNMISSYVKISCYFQKENEHHCYGYIIPGKSTQTCSCMIEVSGVLRKSSEDVRKRLSGINISLKLNIRKEIPHLRAPMYYPLYILGLWFRECTVFVIYYNEMLLNLLYFPRHVVTQLYQNTFYSYNNLLFSKINIFS